MLPTDNSSHESNIGAFGKVFAITLIGAWIGHKLDQTAFGRWFNTNPVLNTIFAMLRIGLILLLVMGLMYFLWCVVVAFNQ